MPIYNRTILVVSILVFSLSPHLFANEVKTFAVKTTSTEIVSDRDHFDVIFVAGWISKHDSFFKNLLSAKSKTAASISASGTYWDQDKLSNAWIIENTDIGANLDRPWGVSNKVLLKGLPADTVDVNIVVKFEIHQDDRLKQILGSIQSSEPIAGVAVEPYLTYAKLVDGVFTSMFGTDKTKYPFLMDSGLADQSVQSTHGMYEHYLVAISQSSDKDTWVKSIDGSKLLYDAAAQTLKYNGQAVTDHTYAVFLIKEAGRPDLTSLLYTSKAPWAVLALTNFYQALLPELANAQDVPKYDKQYVQKLTDCVDLLKRELRFSAFDRANALYAFSERSKSLVAAACSAKSITPTDCKTPQLDSYEQGISGIFGVKHEETKKAIIENSKQLNDKILKELPQ